ncbi:MAG: hypothetical protein MSH48_03735 [Mollicutes bacterium]|nr:hypothetical protein [Mollicutes bacterium]
MGQTSRNRREAYARLDLETNFNAFSKELGNAATAKVAANSICYGTNTVESAKKTIMLVKKIFAANGFNEQQAIEYINQNKYIFEVGYARLLAMLSVLSIAKLDNKAVFENPVYLINEKHNISRMYDAIKKVKAEGREVTIPEIKAIEKEIKDSIEYPLKKERLVLYQRLYLASLDKQIQELENQRVMKKEE